MLRGVRISAPNLNLLTSSTSNREIEPPICTVRLVKLSKKKLRHLPSEIQRKSSPMCKVTRDCKTEYPSSQTAMETQSLILLHKLSKFRNVVQLRIDMTTVSTRLLFIKNRSLCNLCRYPAMELRLFFVHLMNGRVLDQMNRTQRFPKYSLRLSRSHWLTSLICPSLPDKYSKIGVRLQSALFSKRAAEKYREISAPQPHLICL